MRAPMTSRLRAGLASVAGALIVTYVVIDVVLQFLPPFYSVISDAESDLAVGPFGWIMDVNFVARGAMSLLLVGALWLGGPGAGVEERGKRAVRRGAASIRRRIGLILLVVAGLCSVALVFFPTDVNAPGQFGMSQHTATGVTHVVFATAGFLTVLLGMSLLTVTRVQAVLLAVALLGLVSLALSLLFLPQVVGLAERLCLAGILGWALVTARGVWTGPDVPELGSRSAS